MSEVIQTTKQDDSSFIRARTAQPHPSSEEFYEAMSLTTKEISEVVLELQKSLSPFMSDSDRELAQTMVAHNFASFLRDKSVTRSVYKNFDESEFMKKCLTNIDKNEGE